MNYLDIVLHPKQYLKVMFLPALDIATCKLILKAKIKLYKKGTAEYAEIVDLAKAVHALEKIQRHNDLTRQAFVDVLTDAARRTAISNDTKAYLLSSLTVAMNNISVQVENEFTKPKTT